MSVTVTELSTFERRLTLRLEKTPLDHTETRVARRISHDLDIKGFRRGRAPRRMVENFVGKDRIRSEAIDELLKERLPDALMDTGLAPAVTPSVDAVRDVDEGVEVDVLISLWPALDNPPEYEGRRFDLDDREVKVDEGMIEGHLDRHRDQFAELETVERASLEGDYVAIDLHTSRNGQQVEAISVSDFLYEVGAEGPFDGLATNLVGRSAGDIIHFATTLRFDAGELTAGTQVEVGVLVKEVKEKRLPELDDEWVSDFTEFDTVDDLRDDVVRQLDARRLSVLQGQFRTKVLSDLADEIDVNIPEAVIDSAAVRIVDRMRHRLEGSGLDFDDYLEAMQQDHEAFSTRLHQQATEEIRTRLLLDSIAAGAGIEVEDQELRQAYEDIAQELDETADELSRRLSGSVQELALMGDILRSKALDALMQSAVAADRDGNLLDLRFDPPEGGEIVQAEIVEAETEEGDQ